MARWEPDAKRRLELAAFALFQERGFDQTSVVDIAERAGLTERTFFRHFTDKREVLFSGSENLLALLTSTVASAPASMAPLDAVALALDATSPSFEERRDFARKRFAMVAGHPELRERELIKMATFAEAISATLRERGVPEPLATVTAESGITVFKLGFERWVTDSKRRPLTHHFEEAFAALRESVAAPVRRERRSARRA